jgi:uncharacterized protein DUF397
MTGFHRRSDTGNELPWRKSSFSTVGNCVEAVVDAGEILLRDSKDPGGHRLRYTESEWDAFVRGVKNGEFDLFTPAVPDGDGGA